VDVRRALKYIIKPDCTIYEWLTSSEIYICNAPLVNQLRDLTTDFFNTIPLSWHYLSLAKRMVGDIDSAVEAKIKKYFYVLRLIANLNYIAEHGKMPHMEYAKTLAETDLPPEIKKSIDELLTVKLASDEYYKLILSCVRRIWQKNGFGRLRNRCPIPLRLRLLLKIYILRAL